MTHTAKNLALIALATAAQWINPGIGVIALLVAIIASIYLNHE